MEPLLSLPVDVGARSSLLLSETRLPPEIWILIFRFATQLSRFFDARWDHDIVTAFDNARIVSDASESFNASLVCTPSRPIPLVRLIGPAEHQESHTACL